MCLDCDLDLGLAIPAILDSFSEAQREERARTVGSGATRNHFALVRTSTEAKGGVYMRVIGFQLSSVPIWMTLRMELLQYQATLPPLLLHMPATEATLWMVLRQEPVSPMDNGVNVPLSA